MDTDTAVILMVALLIAGLLLGIALTARRRSENNEKSANNTLIVILVLVAAGIALAIWAQSGTHTVFSDVGLSSTPRQQPMSRSKDLLLY